MNNDPFKKNLFNLSFTIHPKRESIEKIVQKLDDVDLTVDVMSSYPVAERMLKNVFNKTNDER